MGTIVVFLTLSAWASSRTYRIRQIYTIRGPKPGLGLATKPLRFIDIEKGAVVEEPDEWTQLSAEKQYTYMEDAILDQGFCEAQAHVLFIFQAVQCLSFPLAWLLVTCTNARKL